MSTVVTYGVGVHLALEAAERVERDGISVEVLDLRTLAPLGREAVARSVKTNKVLIVHEDNKAGGIGAEIAAQLAEEHFEQLDGPILRVAATDIPYAPSLEEAVIPNVDDVEVALRRLAAY